MENKAAEGVDDTVNIAGEAVGEISSDEGYTNKVVESEQELTELTKWCEMGRIFTKGLWGLKIWL